MKIHIIILLIASTLNVFGQVNLVPNPSFEEYTNCPTGIGQTAYIVDWSTFRGSPDYFNSCAPTSSYYSAPGNAAGYQQAANGDAYTGIICFDNSIFSREIIANILNTPLIIGQKYFISFNVSNADDTSVVGYSINKIGAKFSTVMHTNVNIDNNAHIYTSSVISDTVNWTRIAGSFVADSAYKYLMIGNFFDDENTTVVNNSSGFWAYYLVDDVCVSTDSLLCINPSISVEENDINNQFSFYPNPANDLLTITNCSNIPFNLTIYNSIGQQLYSKKNIISNNIQVDTSMYNLGIFFLQINSKNKLFNYKLVKQ